MLVGCETYTRGSAPRISNMERPTHRTRRIFSLGFPFFHRVIVTRSRADVYLPRTPDLDVTREHHLTPVREPPDHSGYGKEHGEVVEWEANGPIDQSGEEIHVRGEPAGDEVVVGEGGVAERERGVEQGIATRQSKDVIGNPVSPGVCQCDAISRRGMAAELGA